MKNSQKKSNESAVKKAICDLQRQLRKAPLTFLTEADVQCFLYHRLLMQGRLNKTKRIQLEGTDKFEKITLSKHSFIKHGNYGNNPPQFRTSHSHDKQKKDC